MLARKLQGSKSFVPPDTDANFKQTVLLLHGDGTNGAQNNTFTDSSTNAFSITRNGNTTQGTFAPYGSNWSTNFVRLGTGYGDGFTFPNSTALQMGTGDFTIEMWVNESGIVSYQTFYEKGYVNSGGFLLQMSTDLKPYVYANGSLLMTSSTAIVVGVWTHLAVVRAGSTMTMYLNGVSVASASNSTNFNDTNIGGIGARSADNTYPFNGYISNLRVVKGTAVYTAAFTPPTAPLTAISGTSLLVMQSNRFIDNSGNNVALTAQNTPSVQAFSPFAPSAAYSASTNGGSGYFDGTGDYLTTANGSSFSFGTGDFTIECWVYLTSGTSHDLADVDGGTTGYWLWNIYSGSMYWQNIRTSTNLISVSLSNYQNQWVHFAAVRSSGTLKIYQNGVEIASASNTTDYSGTSGNLRFGYAGVTALTGYISNFRIVKGTAVYTAAFTPPTSPLTAITNTSLLCNFTNAGIIDNTGKNNLETVGNAQIDTGTKKFGTGSLEFDGTGDYLVMAGPKENFEFGTGDFTIEFWLRLVSTPSAGNYFSLYDSRPTNTNGIYPTIYLNGTSATLVYYVDSADRITGSGLSTGQWYHIAVSRSGTSTKLFIDGTQSGSTYTDSNNYIGASSRPVIGASGYDLSDGNLNGFIDDLRITKGVARYTANFTAPTKAFPDL
jgi:hypothetical protein